MSHSHSHHHHGHVHHTSKNIRIAFLLNTIFTVIEIAGGFYTNSYAILSDALHDLGDSLALGLAWFFQNYAERESDKFYSFGYKRFSVLAALINGLVLLVGSCLILYNTIPRLLNPQAVDAPVMIIISIIGIIFNGAAVLQLKKGTSLNERVVSLHLLEDVLGWAAVLAGSIVMYFFDVPVIDPILSILISAYILYNVYGNLKRAFNIFLQGAPVSVDREALEQKILSFKAVKIVKSLQIWSLDGEHHVINLKLKVSGIEKVADTEKLKEEIRHELEHMGILDATIEIEN